MLMQVEEGGTTGEVLHYPPAPSSGEVDPTGAGDTFLAALVATVVHRTLGGSRRHRGPLDLAFASAAGALAVEAVGLAGAPTRAAVLQRMVRLYISRVAETGAGLRADSFEVPAPTDPASVPSASEAPTS